MTDNVEFDNENADNLNETFEESVDAGTNTDESADSGDATENAEVDGAGAPEEVHFTAEQQRYLGKLLSQERAKERKRAQAQSVGATNAPTAAPAGTIYDPLTEEYLDINSVEGQLAARELKIQMAQTRKTEQQLARAKELEQQELQEKLLNGHTKFDNYQQKLELVAQYATQPIVDALAGMDEPDRVVAFLGEKKGEIQRIAQMTPAHAARELFRLEETLAPRKKLVSGAPAPIQKPKNIGGSATTRHEDMNLEQRKAYYENLYNSPR